MVKGVDPKDSVWADLKLPGARVWLYYNSIGDLVGVGALGESTSTIKKNNVKVPVTVLTNLAVVKRFQRVPKGDGEDGYGKQILRDLRATAEAAKDRRPLLTLCVHPDNPAFAWYRRRGFEVIEPPLTKAGYFRMALDLHKAPPF